MIAADTAAWVAKEDRAVAFLPLPDSVVAPGETLVVPRAHRVDGVLDVGVEDLAATMALVQRVGRAMVSELVDSGVCVLNASGPDSGRSVTHLHFHVVPHYPGDECLPWPSGRSTHHPHGDPRLLLSRGLGLHTGGAHD